MIDFDETLYKKLSPNYHHLKVFRAAFSGIEKERQASRDEA
jgi:hypothetical protein